MVLCEIQVFIRSIIWAFAGGIMKEEISIWWKKALRDPETANNNLKCGEWEAAAFYCAILKMIQFYMKKKCNPY